MQILISRWFPIVFTLSWIITKSLEVVPPPKLVATVAKTCARMLSMGSVSVVEIRMQIVSRSAVFVIVGELVGECEHCEGESTGEMLGDLLGASLGEFVGIFAGLEVGELEGDWEGESTGEWDGASTGEMEGEEDGEYEGEEDGELAGE